VHGVFPSDRGYSASSRRVQFSLSRCWRQRGSRYAIRAGRNLPDKEFRYLRTVIVTAAVYRGFDSELAPLLLTFRHAGRRQTLYVVLRLRRACVFSKQSPPPLLCPCLGLRQDRAPFSRSYGGIFAEFLQHRSLKRLGMLYQSTSVGLGTVFNAGAVSWKSSGRPANPIRRNNPWPSSRSGRLGNIKPHSHRLRLSPSP